MDDSALTISPCVRDIVTDDGAWRMRSHFNFNDDHGTGTPAVEDVWLATWVLDGDGEYEGLSVVLAKDGQRIHGQIISTDLVPPAPEDASTE